MPNLRNTTWARYHLTEYHSELRPDNVMLRRSGSIRPYLEMTVARCGLDVTLARFLAPLRFAQDDNGQCGTG